MSGCPTAAMVVIGNEILSGKVRDSNSPFLASQLRELGVSLERMVTIPDDVEIIARTVREYSEAWDHVFTSGGVGPTHDDVTIEGIAQAFGVGVERHPVLEDMIRRAVGERVTDVHLKMAEVPAGATLVDPDEVPFPTATIGNVYILPGIPELFEAKILAMRERFRSRPYHLRQVLVARSESQIAAFLDATLAAFPQLMLGSYPKLADPEYQVRLTLESKDEAYVEQALADLVARMPHGFVVKVVS